MPNPAQPPMSIQYGSLTQEKNNRKTPHFRGNQMACTQRQRTAKEIEPHCRPSSASYRHIVTFPKRDRARKCQFTLVSQRSPIGETLWSTPAQNG